MDQPVVQTSHGTVLGTTTDGITRFLGIPYADAERFESPTPTSWEGELDATLFGPPSPQRPYPNRLGDLLAPVPGLPSECRDDILRLNIWAPLRLPSSSPPLSSTSHPSSAPPLSPTSHPVLLWLHGGALERGSPAQPGNSGVAFARNGIVFVSPTYRLGVEGWSSFAPNLGLEDVAAALQWVYNNIGAFGGDPNRISVKGESAGGVLTACLLAKENTLPLISRAIIMSAPLQVEPSCTATRGVAKQLNIPETKEAFMTKSVAQVLDARARQVSIQGDSVLSGAPIFRVVLDPPTLPTSPHLILPALKIPIMIGTTTEEYKLFLSPSELEDIGWLKLYGAGWWLGGLRAVRALWTHFASYGEVFGQLVSDVGMRKPADSLASARQEGETWVYEFAHAGPLGAAHATELPFVFDALASPDGLAFGGGPQELAEEMHAAWVRFVKGEAPWEAYGTERMVRVFGGDANEWARTHRVRRADVLDALP